MKIIFLLASLGSGGAERVVSLLADKMSDDGHEVQVICLKVNEVYYQLHEKVKVVMAMEKSWNRFTELFWLRRYLKREKPNVVIPFTEGVYCFTIASLLGTGIPVIASERLDPSAMSLPRKILKRLLLPYADRLVVQTQTIKDYFPKKIQEKTSVIYNPVNDEVFKDSETGITNPLELKSNRIISVARLFPQKNQEMMIRAFAKVANVFPEWQLVIFGEGPLRNRLQLLIDSLQLTDRILLPGRTEHVIEELQKSKIFCLSSDYEGMSNSMIEAICVGLPIISTMVSGTDELIKDGENGLLVEIGNEGKLENCMTKLMSSSDMRNNMAARNHNFAVLFKIENIVDQWMEIIENVKYESQN